MTRAGNAWRTAETFNANELQGGLLDAIDGTHVKTGFVHKNTPGKQQEGPRVEQIRGHSPGNDAIHQNDFAQSTAVSWW